MPAELEGLGWRPGGFFFLVQQSEERGLVGGGGRGDEDVKRNREIGNGRDSVPCSLSHCLRYLFNGIFLMH